MMQPRQLTHSESQPRLPLALRWLLWGAAIAVILFVLYAVGQWRSVLGIYGYLTDWLNANTSIDNIWVLPLALTGTAIFWALIPVAIGFVLFLRKPVQAIGVVAGISFAVTLILYFFGGETFFRTDGRALQCYALTTAGIRVAPMKAGICPIDKGDGTPYQPMTPDIAPSVIAAKRGQRPNRIDPASLPEGFGLYGTGDSRPSIWYEKTKERPFDLFDGPGFHPDLRTPLKPIPVDQEERLRAYVATRREKAVLLRREAEAKVAVEQEERVKQLAAEQQQQREGAESAEHERLLQAERAERQKREQQAAPAIARARSDYARGHLLYAKERIEAVLAQNPDNSQAQALVQEWQLADICASCGAVVSTRPIRIIGGSSDPLQSALERVVQSKLGVQPSRAGQVLSVRRDDAQVRQVVVDGRLPFAVGDRVTITDLGQTIAIGLQHARDGIPASIEGQVYRGY